MFAWLIQTQDVPNQYPSAQFKVLCGLQPRTLFFLFLSCTTISGIDSPLLYMKICLSSFASHLYTGYSCPYKSLGLIVVSSWPAPPSPPSSSTLKPKHSSMSLRFCSSRFLSDCSSGLMSSAKKKSSTNLLHWPKQMAKPFKWLEKFNTKQHLVIL